MQLNLSSSNRIKVLGSSSPQMRQDKTLSKYATQRSSYPLPGYEMKQIILSMYLVLQGRRKSRPWIQRDPSSHA